MVAVVLPLTSACLSGGAAVSDADAAAEAQDAAGSTVSREAGVTGDGGDLRPSAVTDAGERDTTGDELPTLDAGAEDPSAADGNVAGGGGTHATGAEDAAANDAPIDASISADAGDAKQPGGEVDASMQPDASSDASAAAPLTTILFPPPRSYTDATAMTVRGRSAAGVELQRVAVNGVIATTADGFASWSVEVPIAIGLTTLRVSVTDATGMTMNDVDSATVRNAGPSFGRVAALEFDALRNRLIVASAYPDSLAAVDLGASVPYAYSLSGADRGVGPDLWGTRALAVDWAGNRAFMSGLGDILLSVDLESGDRRVLSPESGTEDLSFRSIKNIALNDGVTTAFVLAQASVIAVDLTTGERQVIASDVRGSGLDLEGGVDIAFDPATVAGYPRLLVSSHSPGQIIAIDIASGDRTVLSSTSMGSGAPFWQPGRMQLDAARQRLLVVDGEETPAGMNNDLRERNVVVAVDLQTGDRVTVAERHSGNQDLGQRLYALAFDAARQVAYVCGTDTGQIMSVDLVSNQRTRIVDSDVGSGVELFGPKDVVYNDGTLLVADSFAGALTRVRLDSGRRSEVAGPSMGAGPAFQPSKVVLDQTGSTVTRAFALEQFSTAVFAVDLETGDRMLVSDSGPSGTAASGNPGLAHDPERNRLVVAPTLLVGSLAGVPDPMPLYAVDLATGDWSELSGAMRGSGPQWFGPDDVLIDAAQPSRALVLSGNSVFEVDLDLGDRSILSSAFMGIGSGPSYFGEAMVLTANGDGLLVADTDWLYMVDLDTGQRIEVPGSNVPNNGPDLGYRALGVDWARDVAYVVDWRRTAIGAVDLATGQRVLIAR